MGNQPEKYLYPQLKGKGYYSYEIGWHHELSRPERKKGLFYIAPKAEERTC